MARKLVFDNLSPPLSRYCLNGAAKTPARCAKKSPPSMWQRLNRLYHQMHSPRTRNRSSANINDQLAAVIDGIYLFKGTTDTTMIHGQGWQFIRLGRYLERAYATATCSRSTSRTLSSRRSANHAGYLYLELVGLLRCCTAFEAYCQVYTADLSPTACSSSCCSTATFPTPSATASTARARPSRAVQQTGGRRAPDELKARHRQAHAMLRLHHHQRNPRGRRGGLSAHHPRAMPAHPRTHLPLLCALLHSIGAGRVRGTARS
jgi:uncharacterized alpha-E superfamily protein